VNKMYDSFLGNSKLTTTTFFDGMRLDETFSGV
jgi:hypothetical protein